MIAKSVSYAHLSKGITKLSTADRNALFAGWAVAKYVLGLELDEREAALLQEIGQIGKYGPDDHDLSLRIVDTAIFNLEAGDLEDQALEFAYRVAARGSRSLRQIIVAYGDEPIPNEMAARHCDLFRRVLRAENKPAIYTKHGDTYFDHFHLGLCTADSKTGKVGDWGQGVEIEALHIAVAICEFQDRLKCEPNRRYVADETGVYHTWSGFKVAEANGDIISRGLFNAVRAEQVEFDLEVLAPDGAYVGESLPTAKAIRLLARGVIRQAKNWDQLHRGLARVGIRYEPYHAKGEIEGGHLVAHAAEDKEDDRLAASNVNAGYARLCTKMGGVPYQAAPSDIFVRPFVAPAYRKSEIDASDDVAQDLEQQRQAERELAEFEDAQRARLNAIAQELERGALAREKLTTREAKFRHHNEEQKAAKERRKEAEEILRAIRLAFENEAGHRRKGRPPKTKPIYGVMWGSASVDPLDNEDRPGDWAARYAIEKSGATRTYRLGHEIAFVETAGFVAVHADDHQSKIDALRRAQEKFGTVKVVGTPRFRREMLLLAAQMEIPIDAKQAKEAGKLLAASKTKNLPDEVIFYKGGSRKAQPQRTPTKPHKQLLDEVKDDKERLDEVERQKRGKKFHPQRLTELRQLNTREDAARPPTKEIVAHTFLTTMNCDQLLLCASRYASDGVKFLDDEKLMEKFEQLPQALLRAEVQNRLEAIKRVQQARRDWVLTGLRMKKFQLRGERFTFPDTYGEWPKAFMRGQWPDPTFARQVREAAEGRYTGKMVDLEVRPEIAAWREINASPAENQALARYIVDEWMRVTSRQDRDASFKSMKFVEGENLRRTPGLAAEAYRGHFYRTDGESKGQWERRKRVAKLSDRQAGR